MTETPQVSERQARSLAEESRETEWRKPSFGKELFLGRFRPDLIHPHPRPRAEDVERGEAFLGAARGVLPQRDRSTGDRAHGQGPRPGGRRASPTSARSA